MSKAARDSTAPHDRALVEHRREALERQQLPEEAGHHQRRVARLERPQGTEQHLVDPWGGLAVLGEVIDGFEHRHRPVVAVEVFADATEAVDGLGLGDDVELAATGVELHVDVAGGFETGSELAARLADALGHSPHLAVVASQQNDDPIGFTQLVGAQHDRLVAVQRHDQTFPNRRSRPWYSAMAAIRGSRPKSGHNVSEKTNSL